MSTPKDGGPAFPIVAMDPATGQPINGCFYQGMSLRDWFAGQYLNGIAAGSVIEDTAIRIGDLARKQGRTIASFISSMAYEAADAMLAAREKGQE